MEKDNALQPDWEIRVRHAWPRSLVSISARDGRFQVRGDLVAFVHTICCVCVSPAVRRGSWQIVRIGKPRIAIDIQSERERYVVLMAIYANVGVRNSRPPTLSWIALPYVIIFYTDRRCRGIIDIYSRSIDRRLSIVPSAQFRRFKDVVPHVINRLIGDRA